MDKLKYLLHELRCDIATIPENEENKIEIENAKETLGKAWTELLRLHNVVGQSEQLKAFAQHLDETYGGEDFAVNEIDNFLKSL